MTALPPALDGLGLTLAPDSLSANYRYDGNADRSGIARLLPSSSR